MPEHTFARRLRTLRRDARDPHNGGPLSQSRLADLLSEASGIVYSRAAISDWERDKGHIHKDDRHILVSLLAVLHQCGALLDRAAADAFLHAGNYRALDGNEAAHIAADWRQAAPARDPAERLFLAPNLPTHPIVGREALLQRLKALLFDGQTLALSAINGIPGIGKTALALLVAHDAEIRARFADGVLWVGLGTDPDLYALLGQWALQVGVPAADVARMGATPQRASAIHEAIRGRQMLLVIDDVWDSDHARHFRLGGADSAHVITTRRPTIARAFAGAHAVTVEELNAEAGLDLLRRLAPHVVAQEEALAREVVRATGGLPLALVLIGNDLRQRAAVASRRRVQAALERLLDAERRLALDVAQAVVARDLYPSLPAGAQLSLGTIIRLSDAQLSADAQQALRALALFPPKPNTFDEAAALAVAGCDIDSIDELTDHGLLEYVGNEHYTLHQSIYDYARQQGTIEPAAVKRLGEYYLAFVRDNAANAGSLAREFTNVRAALALLAENGPPELYWALFDALFNFLEQKGQYDLALHHLTQLAATPAAPAAVVAYYHGRILQVQALPHEAETYWQKGIVLARATGDHATAMKLLSNLSIQASHRADYDTATAYLDEAATLAHAIGDRTEEARARANMGRLMYIADRYREAIPFLEQALAIARADAATDLACGILNLLGISQKALGAAETAFETLLGGLQLARADRLHTRTASFLTNIGALLVEEKRFAAALPYLEEGLTIRQHMPNRAQEGHVLMNLGIATAGLGDPHGGLRHLAAALELARAIENRWLAGIVDANRGHVALQAADRALAQACFDSALAIAAAENPAVEMAALAHFGRAKIAAADGRAQAATASAQAALAALGATHPHLLAEISAWRDQLTVSPDRTPPVD